MANEVTPELIYLTQILQELAAAKVAGDLVTEIKLLQTLAAWLEQKERRGWDRVTKDLASLELQAHVLTELIQAWREDVRNGWTESVPPSLANLYAETVFNVRRSEAAIIRAITRALGKSVPAEVLARVR